MFELPELQLPSTEQLNGYRVMRAILLGDLDTISAEQKKSFCQLLTGLDPWLLEADDITLVEKLHPAMWKAYCECHWGVKEEQPARERQ